MKLLDLICISKTRILKWSLLFIEDSKKFLLKETNETKLCHDKSEWLPNWVFLGFYEGKFVSPDSSSHVFRLEWAWKIQRHNTCWTKEDTFYIFPQFIFWTELKTTTYHLIMIISFVDIPYHTDIPYNYSIAC